MKKIILFFTLSGSLFAFGQPTNDDCTGASAAPQDGSCANGTTINANPSMAGDMNTVVGCGPAAQGNDVWYTFVATGSQWAFTLTNPGTGPIGLALFDNGCPGGPFGTLSTACGFGASISGSYSSLIVGDTYYVLIITKSNKPKNFTLCGTSTTPAPNSNNTDCSTATPLCNSSTQSGNSNGFGTQELNASNQGCLSTEHQSSWYTFTVQTSGTFNMTITPASSDDYDFALWGPNSPCSPNSTPIRCDYDAGFGDQTGIGPSGTSNSEGACCNQFVNTLNVTAGQTYILMIDNFSSSSNPFDLSFGGTANLDCSVVLPIELKLFTGKSDAAANSNEITWVTGSELNSDYFMLETSSDGLNFQELTTIKGAGNSNTDREYSFSHVRPANALNYYRLTEVDKDGVRTGFNLISVDNKTPIVLVKTFNSVGQEVSADTKGLVFEYYSDGSVKKVYHN